MHELFVLFFFWYVSNILSETTERIDPEKSQIERKKKEERIETMALYLHAYSKLHIHRLSFFRAKKREPRYKPYINTMEPSQPK